MLCGGLGEGIFDTLSERKCNKTSNNLTRLPGRHGGGQCDRRETRMVGENQPRDQPSKLEGGVCVCVGGGGEPEWRLLRREWEKRTSGRRE